MQFSGGPSRWRRRRSRSRICLCRNKSLAEEAVESAAAVIPAATTGPRGERAAAADSRQLRGECTGVDQVGREERVVSEPIINFRDTGEDFAEFRALIGALKNKTSKADVRIICRDLMKQESVDMLVAKGFPPEAIRFQPACHNKTIIVDGEVVMFGSHNWSNEGVKTNRDASLIFDDPEIADYLAQVYEYDWKGWRPRSRRAKPRVAERDEPRPPGSNACRSPRCSTTARSANHADTDGPTRRADQAHPMARGFQWIAIIQSLLDDLGLAAPRPAKPS